MKKILFIALGTLSLILGTLGIFLPVLPTTPFYLLTAWLYMRSSEKLYNKVMSNRYFGNTVCNYCENKGITKKTKIISITTTVATIGVSIILVKILFVRILLVGVAIGVSIHLLRMKTLD